MDVVDSNPCMDVANPDPCTTVANLCMVLLVMVNENLRVKKLCSAYEPTMILIVYGLADGL